MSEEIPLFKKGELSYVGGNLKVLSWKTLPEEQSTVRVGNYCSLACNITFYVDGNHRYDHASTFPFYELGYCTDNIANKNCWGKGAPVVGHDVWIGNDATIMSGVTLGHGCVVGAKSVVTKSIPPYAIVGGNPAIVLKYRFEEETRSALLASEWWNLPKEMVIKELAPLQFDVDAFLEKVENLKNLQNKPFSFIPDVCWKWWEHYQNYKNYISGKLSWKKY